MAAFDEIEWAAYAQPWGNSPQTVPRLLARLAAVGRGGLADDLRSPLLFALGNDHAGTYYPLAVPAARCLADVLRDGAEAARWQALDLLTDLLGSFEPDPDVVPTAGERRALAAALLAAGESLRPLADATRDDAAAGEDVRQAAREYLGALDRAGSRPTSR